MTDKARFQVGLDLVGKNARLRAPFERAMEEENRSRADMLRLILEDWAERREKEGADSTQPPPARPRSGERAAFKGRR